MAQRSEHADAALDFSQLTPKKPPVRASFVPEPLLDSFEAASIMKIHPKEDWVFASPVMRGKQPYWPDNLTKRYIKPAARKAGINKNIGWHTF